MKRIIVVLDVEDWITESPESFAEWLIPEGYMNYITIVEARQSDER